jgi:hypothetical protein
MNFPDFYSLIPLHLENYEMSMIRFKLKRWCLPVSDKESIYHDLLLFMHR